MKWTIEELEEKFAIEIWNEDKIQAFNEVLLSWYDSQEASHNFPWRLTKDPYEIWISEIMLQQTKTETVIPYYKRFLATFPTIETLANAPEEQVLKLWEGLGYYSRARNLKEAATQIMLHHDGVFPNKVEDIIKLKGIGPYTAGAVGSMAFNLPIPAIDGNLMRVLSRLFEVDLDISVAKNRKVFETVALYLIDQKRPGDWNQALMDLGRTVCTPKNYFPEKSPVKAFNASYLNETWEEYPVKKAKNKPKPASYIAVIIQNNEGAYLLEQRPSEGLLASMWTFPLIEVDKIISDGTWKSFEPVTLDYLSTENKEFLKDYFNENYCAPVVMKAETSGVVQHVFSHLKWSISLFEGKLKSEGKSNSLPENCKWITLEKAGEYVYPTVQKKMWDVYNELTLF